MLYVAKFQLDQCRTDLTRRDLSLYCFFLNNKTYNSYFCRRRQQRLEQEQADIEHEIRIIQSRPAVNRIDADKVILTINSILKHFFVLPKANTVTLFTSLLSFVYLIINHFDVISNTSHMTVLSKI